MQASNQIIEIPIPNGTSPKQAKAVPLTLDFSVATGQAVQLVDLTNAQQRGVIDSVQSIFLDTSAMTQAVSVVIQGSNMIIVAEPNTQGFYPVLCPPPLRFTFASTLGGGSLRAYLVNVAMPTSKWPTTASGSTGTQLVQDVAAENSLATLAGAVSAGKVLVTDTSAEASLTTLAGAVSAGKVLVTDTSAEASLTTLAGAVSAGKVLVSSSGIGSNGLVIPTVGNYVVRATLTTTSPVTLVTPSVGYYVTSFSVFLTADAAGGGALQAFYLKDSVSGVFGGICFSAPSSSGAIQSVPTFFTASSPPGFYFNNKSSGSLLQAYLNQNLTSGSLTIQVYYGLCNFVG